MENIIVYALFLLTYGIGFLSGRASNPHARPLPKPWNGRSPQPDGPTSTPSVVKSGAVTRPDVQTLNKRDEPLSVQQSKQAVKEALESMPEWQEYLKLLREYQGGT